MTTPSLSHARHDRAHCGAPGLFRALQCGERKKSKLETEFYYPSSDTTVFFWGPEPLGAEDLRVLYAIVAEASQKDRGGVLRPESGTEKNLELRSLIGLNGNTENEIAMAVKTDLKRIACEAGYRTDNGKIIREVRECIRRLSAVTIYVSHGNEETESRILNMKRIQEDGRKNGSVEIVLNPRIARAIADDKQYIRINLEEVRSLNLKPAVIMHQWLCSWINPGATRSVNLDRLMDRVWQQPASPGQPYKNRRQKARKCLQELQKVGWGADIDQTDTVHITRPKTERNAAQK